MSFAPTERKGPKGPLSGVRVLDLSLFLPGPHLTMMMADHGAEVVKVEPPTGEPVREVGLKQAGVSTWFRNTHRGKRCIVLDLKSAEGRAIVQRLVQDADIVLFLYRAAYYNAQNGEENQANENEAECIVAKNRHGETSVVRLGWDGAHTRFSNLDVTHEF